MATEIQIGEQIDIDEMPEATRRASGHRGNLAKVLDAISQLEDGKAFPVHCEGTAKQTADKVAGAQAYYINNALTLEYHRNGTLGVYAEAKKVGADVFVQKITEKVFVERFADMLRKHEKADRKG